MTNKDQLFLISKRLFEKRNIILLIVLIIIFLILFSSLTIIQFSVENKREILNSELGRTYVVYPKDDQLEKIKKLEHIEILMSSKYYSQTRLEIKEFDNGKDKGIIYIKPLLKDNDIKIKMGDNLKNKYDIVCTDIFYPYDYDDRIYSNLFVSGKDIINKKININSQNEDLENKELVLKIVGTYKNKYMEEANVCYTSIETYDEIASKYMGRSESYDEYGNLVDFSYTEYNGYVLRIDDKKNTLEVVKELDNLNVEYGKSFILDNVILNILYFIPLILSIIIIILTCLILGSFITKKNVNRTKNIGMLKAIGYDDKEILNITIKENILIVLMSSIISFIMYYTILKNLTYTLLAEVTYNSYILNVPYLLIGLVLIILVIIINKVVKNNLRKMEKFSICELLMK